MKTEGPTPDSRIELERVISKKEYLYLLENFRDPSRETLEKDRCTFLFDGQYWEVDVFHGKNEGRIYLERELTNLNSVRGPVPHFLDVDREVTNEKGFSNADLALVKN